MFSVVLAFGIIGLGRILISDLVVANLLMYSLSGMFLLYLAVPFFTLKVFLDEIVNTLALMKSSLGVLCFVSLVCLVSLVCRAYTINLQPTPYNGS